MNNLITYKLCHILNKVQLITSLSGEKHIRNNLYQAMVENVIHQKQDNRSIFNKILFSTLDSS